jgi:hypothetical protein
MNAGCNGCQYYSLRQAPKFLMNGAMGDRICHARGSHQGDLLSPLLFLFVMEVLHTMIRKADEWSLLSLIGV